MVYTGYLQLGGREVVNGGRTSAYVQAALPTLHLSGCTDCEDLHLALGHKAYTSPLVDQPEWFDPDNPDTWDFYGLYPLSFEGFEDATTEASVTQYINDGGSVSAPRRATRSMRVTGLLIGATPAAVSAGMTWLRQVLRPGRCRDGTDCTGDHLCYLVACPPLCEDSPALEIEPANHLPYRECETGVVIGALGQCTFPYERHLYSSTVVDGPTIVEEFDPSCGAMVRVEFTIVSGVPSPFGTAVHVSSGPTGELASVPNVSCDTGSDGGVQVLRTNLSPNPAAQGAGGWVAATPAAYTVTEDGVARRPGVATVKLTRSTVPTPVVATVETNLVANPSMETGTGTVEVRRNLTTTPRGTTLTGWPYSAGDEVGTTTAVTGAADGPQLPDGSILSTYIRRTVTTPKTAGSTGFQINSTPVTIAAGDRFVTSLWIRSSVATTINGFRLQLRSGSTSVGATDSPSVALPAGQWTLLSVVGTAATGAGDNILIWPFQNSGTIQPGGSTMDVTGLIVEKATALGQYFDGVTRPVLRTNLAPNPRPASAVTGWTQSMGTGATATTAVNTTPNDGPQGRTGFFRVTVTATPSAVTSAGPLYRSGVGSVPVAIGDTVAAAIWFRAPITTRVRLSVSTRAAGVGVGTGSVTPFVDAPAGVWTRLTMTHVATVAGDEVQAWAQIENPLTTLAVGQNWDLGSVTIERGSVAGDYFDGATAQPAGFGAAWSGTANASPSYTYDADLTNSWTGTANASASVVTGVGVANLGTGGASEAARVQSTRWAADGTRSVRTIPRVSTSTNTYVELAASGTAGFPTVATMIGKTYTATATGHLDTAQTGTGDARARRLVAICVTPAGNVTVQSPALANVAGTTERLSVTFSVPATTTSVSIRGYNGASAGNGDVWWDSVVISEGSHFYGEPYWDGSTVSTDPKVVYAWTGAVNASTSTRTTYADNRPTAGLIHVGGFGTSAVQQGKLVPGLTHLQSLYVLSPLPANVTLRAQPVTDAGATVGAAAVKVTAVSAGIWTRVWVGFTAPATATRVAVTADVTATSGNVEVGSYVLFSDSLLETDYGTPRTYFDGNFPSTVGSVDYRWEGVQYQSSSLLEQTTAPSGPILDPDCDPVPTPPRPPVIDTACIDDPAAYLRYSAQVPADAVPLWSDAVPIIRIYSGPDAVRQLRVRFYANPFEVATDQLGPCEFCGEFIVSYLPPNSLLTVDGITQTATITRAGSSQAQAASHLLYGSDGGPMLWPHLTCGIRYDMAVDIVPDVLDLHIDLCVAGRE